MLGALLLVGLVTSPISTFAMFVPTRERRRNDGALAFSRRFVTAVVGTGLLAAAALGVLLWLGVARSDALTAAVVFVLFSIAWLPITRRWNGRAHTCWASCVFLYVAYLVFIIYWTFASHLGVGGTIGGIVLWCLELIAGLMAGAYLWELCDALGTEHWRRRLPSAVQPATPTPADHLPFVSLHVPAHNEPPDMVIETLQSLMNLDYPHFEIVAIDDNTDDPEMWQPVHAFCAANGVKFVHLSDWPGYKSGALNYALANLTDPRAEVIGVVDSDYQIAPNFLRSCAPLFADPAVGFIQAPQDYRDWRQASYYRRLYYSYKYFFAVSQPSRNERDAAIFAGTMGLIRRRTLEAVGGWDEWCITEDAELSLRVLRAGWSGLHVDDSFGHGVMPLTFEALKSQRYRWCFGGIQILRMHWRSLRPGQGRRDNHLSLGQRWGYLAGGLQWYGDVLGVVFYLFLLGGAVNLALGGGQLFRKLTGFLVAAVPVLVGLGLVRAVALLRRGTGATWKDAFGAFFIWQSTSLAVARASIQGLYARKAVFMRTPKTFDEAGWWQVVRANWAETSLAALGALGILAGLLHPTTLSGPLLVLLLLVPTLGYAAAPFNSHAAQKAALPTELTQRRRTEALRQGPVVKGALLGGTVAFGAGIAAVLALMLTPSTAPIGPPRLVGPNPVQTQSSSQHSRPATPSRSGTSHSSAPATQSAPSTSTPASPAPSSSSSAASSAAPSSSSAASSPAASSSSPGP